jgi:ketosteroid isomerase-like protein
MSEADVAVVRATTEAWRRRDWETWKELHDPNVVVVAPEGWPEAGRFEGYEAWEQQRARLLDSWEDDDLAIEEAVDAGGRVLVRWRWATRGKDSGIEFETSIWGVVTVSAGKVTRIDYFLDAEQARSAAGLS